MLTGLWRALASAGNKSAISGKGWPGDVHGRIVWQGLVQGYSGGIDNGVSEGPVMVVHPRSKSESSLAEALRLVKTYTGSHCPYTLVGTSQHSNQVLPTFLGTGVIKSLSGRCEAMNCSELFINGMLTPVQHRNLEKEMGFPVLDRLGLIIKIFAQRAQTREAKLQVQLAALEYEASRLVRILDDQGRRLGFGEGGGIEVVSARQSARGSSGVGGLGGGGSGEKELTLQKHKLSVKKKRLRTQIERVRKTRALHRQGRVRGNIPVVAVIGYTNAGKSTLVSKLTKKELEQDDLLFKTLDPAARRLVLPSGKFAVLSDTVGFISDLPVSLVDAFQATLEEVLYADVLLHVIDTSDKNASEQKGATMKVLRDLGMSDEDVRHKLIEVWNKADLVSSKDISTSAAGIPGNDSCPPIPLPLPAGAATPKIFVSAVNGNGLSELRNVLEVKLGSLYGHRKWAPPWVHGTDVTTAEPSDSLE